MEVNAPTNYDEDVSKRPQSRKSISLSFQLARWANYMVDRKGEQICKMECSTGIDFRNI